MNIIIKKSLLIYKGNRIKCSIGKSGTTSKKIEGDLSTPRGTYKLGKIYFRKDRISLPKCKLSTKVIKKNMGWSDDIFSKKYNQEISNRSKFKSEKLYRKDNLYNIFINIKYNSNPVVKKKGSAIFLHLCNRSYKPTKGCIAIKLKDMLKILPLITKKTKIIIK